MLRLLETFLYQFSVSYGSDADLDVSCAAFHYMSTIIFSVGPTSIVTSPKKLLSYAISIIERRRLVS
jgi:hypothetical protein